MTMQYTRQSWCVLIGCAALTASAALRAQEPATAPPPAATPPPQSSAQIEAGEPRADTSPAPPASPPPAASKAAAPAAKAARTAPTPGGPKSPAAADRLDLGAATVTGDREQPKVMYIVPWKRSDIGDLSGKPMNSLLDEALAPVDRDEFKREVAYYGALKSDGSGSGAPNEGVQGEK